MRRNSPRDALCRRCDDSGIIADGPERWRACTCASGAIVLEQLAATGRVAA